MNIPVFTKLLLIPILWTLLIDSDLFLFKASSPSEPALTLNAIKSALLGKMHFIALIIFELTAVAIEEVLDRDSYLIDFNKQ